jgi:hypothetical protein
MRACAFGANLWFRLISVLLLQLRGDFDCNLRKIVDKGSAGKREC